MTQAIAVYIVNLTRRPDRLERLGGQLDALGIAWERIDACDAREASAADLDAVIAEEGPLGRLGNGDRACTVSHLRAWQRLLSSDRSHALVLEDDVYLAADSRDVVASTDWIPPGVEVVKLEKFGARPSTVLLGPAIGTTPNGLRQIHRLESRHAGGAAYILSRKAAEEGLKLRGQIRVPVDHLLFNANVSALARRLKPVVIRPAMATQRQYGYNSDIAAFGKAVKPTGWRFWRRRLKRGFYEIRCIPQQAVRLAMGRARPMALFWQEHPDRPEAESGAQAPAQTRP